MSKITLAAASALVLLVGCCTLPDAATDPLVLRLSAPDGSPRGSGVVIADDWVLTAKHVLPVGQAGTLPVVRVVEHPTDDLALLYVPGVRGHVKFGAAPRVHDRLYAIGYHVGAFLLKTEGYQGGTTGTMSAEVFHGASGGAVVNARGELVGIVKHVIYARTPLGDSYAVPHIAGYTPVTEAVQGWILNNTNP